MNRNEAFDNAKNPFILQQRVEEMIYYTHLTLEKFPKCEKHVLCAEIKSSMLVILKLTIRMKKKYYKKNTLQDIDIEVDSIRALIKLSDKMGYISHGKMQYWLQGIDEIGRIIGGLMKTFDK